MHKYLVRHLANKSEKCQTDQRDQREGIGMGSWLQTTPPQRVASRCVYIYLTFKRFAQTVMRPKAAAATEAEAERRKLRQRDSGNTLHSLELSAEFVQAACSDIMLGLADTTTTAITTILKA